MKNRDDYSSLAYKPYKKDIFYEVSVPAPSNEPAKPETSPLETLEKSFDVFKKLVDIVDDVWNAIGRTSLPAKTVENITPKVVGSTSLIIFAFEGMEGGKLAYEAIKARNKDKTDPLNDTDLVVGLLTTFWSAIGYYLSLAFLIVNAIGSLAGIIALSLASSILSGLLTAIYSLALLRNVEKLLDANEKYADAEKVYDNNKKPIASTDKINNVSSANNPTIAPKKYADSAVGVRDKALNAKLEAERNVSFKAIEVVAASLVFAATIVTAVVSFGTVPAILLGVGVAVGLACKAFEYVDEKYDHKFSNGMRRFFKNAWDFVFSEDTKNQNEITNEKTVAAMPTSNPCPKSATTSTPIPNAKPIPKIKESIQNHYPNSSIMFQSPEQRFANNQNTAYTQLTRKILTRRDNIL